MEYSWDIQTLKRDLTGDVVINVRWDCTATYNSASSFIKQYLLVLPLGLPLLAITF